MKSNTNHHDKGVLKMRFFVMNITVLCLLLGYLNPMVLFRGKGSLQNWYDRRNFTRMKHIYGQTIYKTVCILIFRLSCFLSPIQILAQSIPEDALIFKEKGDHAFRRCDTKEAVYYYDRALKIYSYFPDVLFFLGRTYELDYDDLVNAIYYYRWYLMIKPNGPDSEEVSKYLINAEKIIERRKRELLGTRDQFIPSKNGITGIFNKESSKLEITPASFSSNTDILPRYTSLHVIASQKGMACYECHTNFYRPPVTSVWFPINESNGVSIFKIKEKKLYKYLLKLKVWKREGFVKRFNRLTWLSAQSIKVNITSRRENLRLERKKVTESINYRQEGIRHLLERAVLMGMGKLGIELNHCPRDLSIEKYVIFHKVSDYKENERFVFLSIQVAINTELLKRDLLDWEYTFEPKRITFIFHNVKMNLSERLTEQIINYSNYIGPMKRGLYPLYTSMKVFIQELEQLQINKYRFRPVSIGKNSISLEVYLSSPKYRRNFKIDYPQGKRGYPIKQCRWNRKEKFF